MGDRLTDEKDYSPHHLRWSRQMKMTKKQDITSSWQATCRRRMPLCPEIHSHRDDTRRSSSLSFVFFQSFFMFIAVAFLRASSRPAIGALVPFFCERQGEVACSEVMMVGSFALIHQLISPSRWLYDVRASSSGLCLVVGSRRIRHLVIYLWCWSSLLLWEWKYMFYLTATQFKLTRFLGRVAHSNEVTICARQSSVDGYFPCDRGRHGIDP